MNIYRISELILCLFIIITGILYKFADLSLSVTLPVMALLFSGIPFLRYVSGKKQGLKGIALYFPVICMAVIAIIVIAAYIIYKIEY